MANDFDKFVNGVNKASSAINNFGSALNGLTEVKEQGFSAPNAPGADNGLPFTKVSYGVPAVQPSKRHLINWFVPDMGVVRMYVNPENISYSNRKAVRSQRTKGGYSLQYWGEELTTIGIRGNTGSSGVEGINALYEVYRSEQYTYDAVGMTLSSNNASENMANNLANKLVGAGGKAIGGIGDSVAGAIGGAIFSAALAPVPNLLSPQSLPSLANNAFTVEMYYMGWVYRGFFNSMSITESTDLLFSYDISFTATQRRGYRTNYLPWHKTPIGGGGNFGNHFDIGEDYSTGTATSPYYSFNGYGTR
jgi:hypothetical protein